MKIFILITFFSGVVSAHEMSFNCITALGKSLAGLSTLAPNIESHWKNINSNNELSENAELVTKIEKKVRNAFLLERIKSRHHEAPLSDFNNQGLLLDAAKQSHLSKYELKDVLEFVVQYNNLNRQKNGIMNRGETAAQHRKLMSLAQELNSGEFLRPTILLVEKQPTLVEELLAAVGGKALIEIGSHELTVKSLVKAIRIQKLMNKEMQHMADTSLAGANKYSEIADHLRLTFKNSQNLIEGLLMKIKILGASHPNLEKAVISMLHTHVSENGSFVKKLSIWSLTHKIKNDFEFFPIHTTLYEYTRRTKETAADLTMNDFVIAREWLAQELTREE